MRERKTNSQLVLYNSQHRCTQHCYSLYWIQHLVEGPMGKIIVSVVWTINLKIFIYIIFGKYQSRILIMTAVGIDLGTTYSCVAAIRNGKIEIIANDQGNRVTPSYVAFTYYERIVGDAAKHQESMNTENTLYQMKRLIGREYNDVALQKDLKLWKFKVSNDKNNPKLTVNYQGKQKTFCPEEISAMVLSYMKETAEAYLGKKISDAVITVPAHFNDAQRKATRDAGTIAGLNVLAMINEPTAAAIAYGLERGTIRKRTVLIYDLGGGTFDITIFRIENNVIDVLASGGDSHLGGEDFTDAMLVHFSSEFNLQHNVDMMQNPKSISRLRKECELAKRALSTSTSTTLQVECLHNGIDFSISYSRTKFEILNQKHFTKTLETVKSVMKDAGVSKEQIDDIVLVGGSTRIPKVSNMMKEYFHKEVLKTINVDEAVAYGAAVQAAILTNDPSALIKEIKLHDVASLSMGIETRTSDMVIIVPRNTRIPTKKWHTFVTRRDNQSSVHFPVYEGERPCTDDNHHLGTFDVDNLPPLPKGEVKFDVCFEIDNAGMLTVTARDKVTGKKNNIVISNDKGIKSQEEIERMIAEAKKFKEDDQNFRERSAFINEFEDFIYNTKKSLHEIKRFALEEEKTKVLNKCIGMEKWLKFNQKTVTLHTLELKKKELEGICHPFLGKLYLMQKHN